MKLADMTHLFVCGSRLTALSLMDQRKATRRMEDALEDYWAAELGTSTQVVVVTGDAQCGDEAGAQFARRQRLGLIQVTPAWQRFRFSAGPIRNSWMIQLLNADAKAIAFWDDESQGTKNAIDLLRHRKIEPRIINPLELL